MQTHQIKNHMMSLTVAEHGAEITSIQLEGIERMWDADPAFWGRTAPVLFPIVGALIRQKINWNLRYLTTKKPMKNIRFIFSCRLFTRFFKISVVSPGR